MSAITIILVVLVAFLAGLEGILDEWEFHQPILACTLIGLVTGHLVAGVLLGGALQMIALGWANIGAAVAPDAALASVASALLMVKGWDWSQGTPTIGELQTFIAAAIVLATAGLVLTTIVRFITVGMIHVADSYAEKGSYAGVTTIHLLALLLQGLRIAIPAGVICAVSSQSVQNALNAIPDWLKTGLSVGGGMVVVVGYAMVINIMATAEIWPFFFLGFVLAPLAPNAAGLNGLSLIAMGILGVVIALIYLTLSEKGSSGGVAGGTGDPIGDILNDY